MASLKYDFEEFQSKHWLYTDTFANISNEIPVNPKLQPELQFYMSKMLVTVKWIIRKSKNPYTEFPLTRSIVNDLITTPWTFMVVSKYSSTTFKMIRGLIIYTLHLLMDVYDIQSLEDNNKYYMNEYVPNFMMPNVYRLFLNITIQHVSHWFNHGLCSTFFEFEQDIDEIFDEINAYISQFTTKSDMPTKREKLWIFVVAFTVVSGLITAYRIYKIYIFRKNVQHNLSYILSNHRHFQENILSKKRYLPSLAEITSSNFKDVRSDIANLKKETNNKFNKYLHRPMHAICWLHVL